MSDAADSQGLISWPAPERNKGPIAEVLRRVLANRTGVFLEIGSATGQHVAHFAPLFPAFRFQPSDCDEQHLLTLRQRVRLANLPNLYPPIYLDATHHEWPVERADVVYSANMIHIAPWEATFGLFRGAARLLPERGLLITYGPYRVQGQHTSESNRAFDESLQIRNPGWGVRDVTALEEVANPLAIQLLERVPMPANNFTLVWQKVHRASESTD